MYVLFEYLIKRIKKMLLYLVRYRYQLPITFHITIKLLLYSTYVDIKKFKNIVVFKR